MQLRLLLRPPVVALLAVQMTVCASISGDTAVAENKREKGPGVRHPEKRGTLRLTAIPGHNTFPYRYVYPLGQPSFAQYAAYTTPRTSSSASAALVAPSSGLKLSYPLPGTAMLLVMAHPHAGSPYGGTFMLIPATSAYNYNLLPQAGTVAPVVPGRVAYAYAIPATPAAHYIKPGYANLVAAHQLLYKGPGNGISSANGGSSAYSGEDEAESAESSTVSTYGSRTRGTQQQYKGR